MITTKDCCPKECTGCDHDCATVLPTAVRKDDAGDIPMFETKLHDFTNDELDAAGNNRLRDGLAIFVAIGLKSRSLDGAPLAAIEHPIVDSCRIRCCRNQAIEDVDFPHQMAFADTADGGVAGKLAEVLSAEGDQADAGAATCGGSGRFAPGVAAANDENVEHGASIYRERRDPTINLACFT